MDLARCNERLVLELAHGIRCLVVELARGKQMLMA